MIETSDPRTTYINTLVTELIFDRVCKLRYRSGEWNFWKTQCGYHLVCLQGRLIHVSFWPQFKNCGLGRRERPSFWEVKYAYQIEGFQNLWIHFWYQPDPALKIVDPEEEPENIRLIRSKKIIIEKTEDFKTGLIRLWHSEWICWNANRGIISIWKISIEMENKSFYVWTF